MAPNKTWIETLYEDRGLENHSREIYFGQLNNPPTLEELQDLYPDIYSNCSELYKDCYSPSNPKLTVNDMIYEDCLEHHNQILKGELMSWYRGLPMCNAYKSLSKLKEKYENQIKKQSKQEFLHEQYIQCREYINLRIFGEDSIIKLQDAGFYEISEKFDVEDPTVFQKLFETYMVAFYCKFFSENKLSNRDFANEDAKRISEALSVYMNKEYIKDQSIFVENIVGELYDWLNEEEQVFDLASFSGKEYIVEMMEDLAMTHDGRYVGNERSKSMLRGFVTACREEGELPNIAIDELCENIASYIKMDYTARLKSETYKCRDMYDKTKKYISSNR